MARHRPPARRTDNLKLPTSLQRNGNEGKLRTAAWVFSAVMRESQIARMMSSVVTHDL